MNNNSIASAETDIINELKSCAQQQRLERIIKIIHREKPLKKKKSTKISHKNCVVVSCSS